MSEPITKPRTALDELFDLIDEAGLRVVFWTCPKGCAGFVDWTHTDGADGKKSTPTCRECGETGAAR